MSNISKLDLYEAFWEAAELASRPELTDEEQVALAGCKIPYSANPIVQNIATLRWQREREQNLILDIVKDFPGDTIMEKVAAMAESLKFHKRTVRDLKSELAVALDGDYRTVNRVELANWDGVDFGKAA